MLVALAVTVSVVATVTDFVPCWTVCRRRWTVSRGCRAVCGGCRRVGRTKENTVEKRKAKRKKLCDEDHNDDGKMLHFAKKKIRKGKEMKNIKKMEADE